MNEEELQKYLTKILENQEIIKGQNAENIWANVFHDTIKGSPWLPADFSLSPGRGAMGYPALYVLYRILNEVQPENILEMGMGQSTKLIGLYNHFKKNCFHQVVEHDPEWISFFCNHFALPETTKVVQLDIKDYDMDVNGATTNVTIYQGFKETFVNSKFDFICIDGPYGFRSPDYSRIDVIGILPACLKETFVIFLDDMQRQGEQNTFMVIIELLKSAGIKYCFGTYGGEKTTGIIVSENLSFLCSM